MTVEAENAAIGEDVKDPQYAREHERDSEEYDAASRASDEAQAGVKKVEAISASWTTGGLIVAYVT
jgi:hypothetical protein